MDMNLYRGTSADKRRRLHGLRRLVEFVIDLIGFVALLTAVGLSIMFLSILFHG